jgi:hypothetical protein
MKLVYILALVVLLGGCDESGPRKRKPRPTPDVPVVDVIETPTSATMVHKQSAKIRAGIYREIASKITAGELKTVGQVADFSHPMFVKAGEKYADDITALRKLRLHDADDELPPDAADAFLKFAAEYDAASK